ncbi:DNA-binding protein [Burkholderia pseudomallei]|uniref:DNA-binding protein n=1 Tax=Burkholderia pseudomallei TaxID=28450 RepID=UPI000977791E|nr:hypothetical protein F5D26_07715 [Burkholderia pseudomallei]
MKQQQSTKGGRPGITLEDVKRACEALRQQGRPVGPVNIRLELGRGSYSTIIRAMRTLGLAPPREAKRKPPP